MTMMSPRRQILLLPETGDPVPIPFRVVKMSPWLSWELGLWYHPYVPETRVPMDSYRGEVLKKVIKWCLKHRRTEEKLPSSLPEQVEVFKKFRMELEAQEPVLRLENVEKWDEEKKEVFDEKFFRRLGNVSLAEIVEVALQMRLRRLVRHCVFAARKGARRMQKLVRKDMPNIEELICEVE